METVRVAQPQRPVISVMLAVADPPPAVAWYTHALGATILWSLGTESLPTRAFVEFAPKIHRP